MKKLYCGFSQADITPDDPRTVYQDGYGHRVDPAEGIRDRLNCKVCAMSDGESTFVIVALDLCGMNREIKDNIRGMIRVITGLKDEEFVICHTHTHAGPACGTLAGLPINRLYFYRIGEIAANAVNQALANKVEGGFRFAFGDEITLSFNRRGKEIIDRRVPVCGFFDKEDKLRGVIASASCHPVCIQDLLISADYPAIMTKRAAETHPGVPFIFLPGRGADVDPHFTGETRDEMYFKLGNEFADSVYAAISRMEGDLLTDCEIKAVRNPVDLPMTYPPLEELKSGLETFREMLSKAKTPLQKRYPQVELIWHINAIEAVKAGVSPTIEAEMQMLSIGRESVFVFNAFEMLTPTGNAIEEIMTEYGIAPEKCFIIGYANCFNGYLAPSAECVVRTYETGGAAHWIGIPECCVESELTVLDAVKEMASELLS